MQFVFIKFYYYYERMVELYMLDIINNIWYKKYVKSIKKNKKWYKKYVRKNL